MPEPDDMLMRRLKLRELRVLVAVTQAGSMAKAAKQLAISQPAVSRAISDMERTLGVPLFDRSVHGIEPTTYGRALLKRGVAIFDELKQGVQDIRFLSDLRSGELRIGSSISLSEGIVLAVVDRLARQYPRVVFHVVPGGLPAQCQDLRERRIELGFAAASGPAPEEGIEAQVLFKEPLIVVTGIQNPWAHRRKIALGELLNEPWTWPSAGSLINSLVVEAFRASGLEPPRATVYADPLNMRIGLAATGRFLAVVPASFLRSPAKHPSLKMLPVDLSTTGRRIGIITLKSKTLSPLAQLFIECAREEAKPLAKRP